MAPELPAHAAGLPALTVSYTRAAGAEVTRQVVSRTATRVHVQTGPPGAPEWLFIRNPVDHRRAAGYFIDHRERAVLVYDDTTLAREGIAAGWRDVLALGVSADLLDGLKPTGATAEIAGATFAHQAAGDDDDGVADGGAEVWWSDDLFVLGRMTSTAGGIVETLELTAMTTEVNPSLLADPGARYPHYLVEDLDDWGEEH